MPFSDPTNISAAPARAGNDVVMALVPHVACRNWQAAEQDWICPACRRRKMKILEDFHSSGKNARKGNLVMKNADPLRYDLSNLLGGFEKGHLLGPLCDRIGIFETEMICHRCSGQKISHVRKAIPPREMAETRELVGFSAAQILEYRETERNDGSVQADLFARSAFVEISRRINIVRGFSETLFMTICRDPARMIENVGIIIDAAIASHERVLCGPRHPFILTTPQSVSGLFFGRPSPEEDHVASLLRGVAQNCSDIVTFVKSCSDEEIIADVEISENGVLMDVSFIFSGKTVSGRRIGMTALHLHMLGVRYDHALHWDELHAISEERHSLVDTSDA